MAFNYALRSCAEEDLTSILDDIAANNPKAALDLYKKFLLVFDLLAQFAEIGRERPELMQGIRSMPLGSYITKKKISSTFQPR